MLELVRVETFVHYFHGTVGCPPKDRAALARSFLGSARFRVQSALDVIEEATGERPDPWNQEDAA